MIKVSSTYLASLLLFPDPLCRCSHNCFTLLCDSEINEQAVKLEKKDFVVTNSLQKIRNSAERNDAVQNGERRGISGKYAVTLKP